MNRWLDTAAEVLLSPCEIIDLLAFGFEPLLGDQRIIACRVPERFPLIGGVRLEPLLVNVTPIDRGASRSAAALTSDRLACRFENLVVHWNVRVHGCDLLGDRGSGLTCLG